MSRCNQLADRCAVRSGPGVVWALYYAHSPACASRLSARHPEDGSFRRLRSECRWRLKWSSCSLSAFVWLNKGYHVLVYPDGPDPLLVGTQGCAS